MRHPRSCPAHYPEISSNINNATDFRTPPTPLTLAHQPSYPHCHNTHITHTSTPPTLTRIACRFWNSNLVCQVTFCSLLFHQILLIFSDVLSFLSFLLPNCSKNAISIWNSWLYFGKVSVVIRKSQTTMFQDLAWGYLRRFNIASPGSERQRI